MSASSLWEAKSGDPFHGKSSLKIRKQRTLTQMQLSSFSQPPPFLQPSTSFPQLCSLALDTPNASPCLQPPRDSHTRTRISASSARSHECIPRGSPITHTTGSQIPRRSTPLQTRTPSPPQATSLPFHQSSPPFPRPPSHALVAPDHPWTA